MRKSFEENFRGAVAASTEKRSLLEAHDPEKYPQFDEALRNAFERESDLFFFFNVMHEDRSVLEFAIDADYTFLNERPGAAQHLRCARR